jgi:hypothetical protein
MVINTSSDQVSRNRREFVKLAGGLAATTGLSVAADEARAASLYWDGVTLAQSGYDYAPTVM